MTNEFAVFAGGCFWCTEAVYGEVRGVIAVTPGYTGGTTKNPTYNSVCTGTTGHAEAIRIEFDSDQLTYRDLLEIFFATHNPTTRNRQGNDVGDEYRSAIFYADAEQRQQAVQIIQELTDQKVFSNPIVTCVVPLDVFYEAENYHKDYYKKNIDQGYCQMVIAPKLKKFRETYARLLKTG